MKEFDVLLAHAVSTAPIGEMVDVMDVGLTCAYLASPFAHHLTGSTVYVDGGSTSWPEAPQTLIQPAS